MINDQAEQDWVFQTFNNYHGVVRSLWLGLIDSPNFDSGMLTVHVASGGNAGDRIKPSGNYSFSGSNFLYFSTVIGTVDSDGTDADLKITFNANATRAVVEG